MNPEHIGFWVKFVPAVPENATNLKTYSSLYRKSLVKIDQQSIPNGSFKKHFTETIISNMKLKYNEYIICLKLAYRYSIHERLND